MSSSSRQRVRVACRARRRRVVLLVADQRRLPSSSSRNSAANISVARGGLLIHVVVHRADGGEVADGALGIGAQLFLRIVALLDAWRASTCRDKSPAPPSRRRASRRRDGDVEEDLLQVDRVDARDSARRGSARRARGRARRGTTRGFAFAKRRLHSSRPARMSSRRCVVARAIFESFGRRNRRRRGDRDAFAAVVERQRQIVMRRCVPHEAANAKTAAAMKIRLMLPRGSRRSDRAATRSAPDTTSR